MMAAQIRAAVSMFEGYLSFPAQLVGQVSQMMAALDTDDVVSLHPQGFLQETGRALLYPIYRQAALQGVAELGVHIHLRSYNSTGGQAGGVYKPGDD